MLGNLLKAAVSVVVTPIALAADVVMLIPDSCDGNKDAFTRTSATLKNAGDNIKKATKP